MAENISTILEFGQAQVYENVHERTLFLVHPDTCITHPRHKYFQAIDFYNFYELARLLQPSSCRSKQSPNFEQELHMKTQNTTSNTAVSFSSAIVQVGAMTCGLQSPSPAANNATWKGVDLHVLGEEVSYWFIVATSFAFQLLLVDLLTVL
jgi:hypothetical protein